MSPTRGEAIRARRSTNLASASPLRHVSGARDTAHSITLALHDDGGHADDREAGRVSVSYSMLINARAPAGLTASRSNLAHDWRNCSSLARLGTK